MNVDKNMKILIAEDSKITRKMEIKILTQLGYETIIEADDGNDAIAQLCAHNDIQLIISDWNMPGKNGYELLQWVRASSEHRELPFIMATAQSEKKQTARAVKAGVSNFVSKPFTPLELQKIIEATFSPAPMETETPAAAYAPRVTDAGRVKLRAAHIQITDHLTLGVLKHNIENKKVTPRHFELETRCMPSWNPVQKALENGEVDAAFVLAPIAMDSFSDGHAIRLVLFAHKNGSIAVGKARHDKDVTADFHARFKGKSFFLPHILSVHHMLSTMFLKELGLQPGLAGKENLDVFFEIVPPISMPEFLANNPAAAGFTVAEPLGTKAIAGGSGELLFLSGELWEYHPCCVVVLRKELIDQHPEAVQEFTDLLVQSGQFIAKNPEKAAEIGIEFLDPEKKLGLNVAVLKNVLKEPQGIKTDDLFPSKEDLDRIQQYMYGEMNIGTLIDVNAFVDTRFAEAACKTHAQARHHSQFHDIKKAVQKMLDRAAEKAPTKMHLDREGIYLIFSLLDQEFGIAIDSVVEIIHLTSIHALPRTPEYIRGVINLREEVIMVMDLRLRLNKPEKEYNDRTCIIILEHMQHGAKKKFGIIVDTVTEVLNIKADSIEHVPHFVMDSRNNYLSGIAKIEDSIKVLIDAQHLFSGDDLTEADAQSLAALVV